MVAAPNPSILAPRLDKLNDLIGAAAGFTPTAPFTPFSPVPPKLGATPPDLALGDAAAGFTPVAKLGRYDPLADVGGFTTPTKLGSLFATPAQTPSPRPVQNPAIVTSPGTMPSPGGDWGAVDRWNDAIAQAQARVKAELGVDVPASTIKAIMRIESGGNFNEGAGIESPHGARGLMQVTQSTMGNYDYDRLAWDAAYGVWAGVNELALRYLDSPGKTWDQAATGYFSGHYVPNGAGDGYNTDYDYLRMYQEYYNQLNAFGGAASHLPGGGMTPGTGAGTAGGNIATIWGGGAPNVSQEFGMTSFAAANPALYNYSRDYNPDGSPIGHTGLDVSMNVGTALYTPVGGTVVCQGSAGGPGDGSSGCDFFGSDVCNGPCGRLEIRLDNGDMLILGHMSNISVAPGTRVEAGTFVGQSGTSNGGHVHVEYRKSTPGQTSSGYTIIDPRTVLNGSPIVGGSAGGVGGGWSVPGYTPGLPSAPGLIGGMNPYDRMRQLLFGGG